MGRDVLGPYVAHTRGEATLREAIGRASESGPSDTNDGGVEEGECLLLKSDQSEGRRRK